MQEEITEFVKTVPRQEDETLNFQRNPEVIANPPLENTKLVISIPTYHKEWERGALLRSVEAMLSQNPSESAIEVNYVVNTGDLHPWKNDHDEKGGLVKVYNPDEKSQRAYGQAQEAVKFLRTVVEIQKLVVNGGEAGEIDMLINEYDDEYVRSVLRLAMKAAGKVSITALDLTKVDMKEIGYTDYLDGFRTAGLDYVVGRFGENERQCVFLMSDTDTVQMYNSMGRDLVRVFEKCPEAKYFFLRMGYLPPGEDKTIVETSTKFVRSKVAEYNLYQIAGSPQIAIRVDALKEIKEIAAMYGGAAMANADRDTSQRLIAMFGDLTKGIVIDYPGMAIPIQLTLDRTMGFKDGEKRVEIGKKTESIGFEEQISSIDVRNRELADTVKNEIAAIDDIEIRKKLEDELVVVKRQLEIKQRNLMRFNRRVISDFLDVRDKIPVDPSEDIPEQVVDIILKEKLNGRSLLGYIRQNRNLIAQVSDEDVEVIKYFLGKRPDNPVKELTTFQKTMREYIGEYPTFGGSTDKTAVLQPILIEIMALGHVHSLYTQRKILFEGTSDGYEVGKGSDWFDKVQNYNGLFSERDKTWAQKKGVEKVLGRVNPVLGWVLKKFGIMS